MQFFLRRPTWKKYQINIEKAPGFDRITGKILIEQPKTALVKLINLINARFYLKCVLQLWKVMEVI